MEVRIREDKRVGGFVSYCPALDVYSQGETHIEAYRAIRSAVVMMLKAQAAHREWGKDWPGGTGEAGSASRATAGQDS